MTDRLRTARRVLVGAGALVLGLVTTTGASGVGAVAPGEPTWRASPRIQGVPVPDPVAELDSGPVLDPGTGDLFVLTTRLSGTGRSHLTRVDGRTGRVRWRRAQGPAGTEGRRLELDAARGRLVTGGYRRTSTGADPFLSVTDLRGEPVWRRTVPAELPPSEVTQVALDPSTGQACMVTSEIVPGATGQATKGLVCFAADGTPVFVHTWQARLFAADQLVVDPGSHRIIVAGGDDHSPSGVATSAFSASGELLWRRDHERWSEPRDLVLDPERGLVHVVGNRARRIEVLTHDLDGTPVSQTRTAAHRSLDQGSVSGALRPQDGRVVVTALARGRLLLHTVLGQGRARTTVVRGFSYGSRVTVDPAGERLLVVDSRRRSIRTTSLTLAAQRQWEHRMPDGPAYAGTTRGVLDPRRGRFTFLRIRSSVSEPFQLRG